MSLAFRKKGVVWLWCWMFSHVRRSLEDVSKRHEARENMSKGAIFYMEKNVFP